MTTCQAYPPTNRAALCGATASDTITVGCVHEHICTRHACPSHIDYTLTQLGKGACICPQCTGHNCEVRLIEHIPTERTS